jgi:glyoxylase-like metal-dependent hydrolase (beta-lactamase superfamily II)
MKLYRIGDIKIYLITESENSDVNPTFFFPDTTSEMWEKESSWMKPHSMNNETGNLIFPIQCYLIDTGEKKILLDACVGDNKERVTRSHWHLKQDGLLLSELQSIGVTTEMIDYVISTHLHADHVGWFTKKNGEEWIPTFQNATYIIQKAEFEFWKEKNLVEKLVHFEDSVLPVLKAGKIKLVDSDFVLENILSYIQTPGHTPNHCSIKIENSGEIGVFTGDLIHSPVQCKHPEWYVKPDYDPLLAIQTRLDFFRNYADSNIIIFPTHVCSPSVGWIIKEGEAYKYQFLNSLNNHHLES